MKTEILAIPEFLDLELLSRLPNLEVQARYLVHGTMAGMHRSPLRGFNVEFKEFRQYQLGDEPKTIDWKVYARTDRLQVKVREEDTNLTSYVVIEASASMNYKGPGAVMSKWEYARSLAAGMILLFQRQRDAPSLAVVGAGAVNFIRPSLKTSDHRRMMAALDRPADGDGGSLADYLGWLAPLVRRRSLVFIVSDFYDDPARLDTPIRQLRHRDCEPIFLHILDPVELTFDFVDPVLLQELETRQRLALSPDLVRKDYVRRLDAHRKALARTVGGYGGDYELLRTDETPYRTLGTYLARRRGTI